MVALISILACHKPMGGCFKSSFVVIFDPQNMGLEALFIWLSALLTEI